MDGQAADLAGQSRSPRVSIARVADQVVAHLPATALTSGPNRRWLTPDDAQAIRGVLVTAQPDGRYELELHLIVDWPPAPLERFAEDLRRRIRAAVKRGGLDAALGEINIHIDDVRGPGEVAPTGATV